MGTSNKLSDILFASRVSRGLSQEGMAELCGISTRHYSDLEQGKVNPRLTTTVRIFTRLGISLDILKEG